METRGDEKKMDSQHEVDEIVRKINKSDGNPPTPKMIYEPREDRRMLKNGICISLSFTLLFTASMSMSNLQSSINQEDGLGNYSQSTVYAALVFSSMILPTYLIRKFTVKWTMCLSVFGYTTYMAAQFHPTFATLIPTAIIMGTCAAPLWISKCTYLTLLANQYASVIEDNAEVIIVRFFGIFFMFFQSAAVWGNLISSTVLSSGLSDEDRIIDLDICGINYCNGGNETESINNISDTSRYTIAGIYLACACAAAVVIGLFVDPLSRYGENERDLPQQNLFIATFKHMKLPYQVLITPLTIWSGIEQGFFSADFTQAFITCSWGVENIGYIFICYGIFDALASVTFSPIIRRVGRIPIFILGAVINVSVIIFMFVWRPNPDYPVIYFAVAALWGIADSIWQTQINALYGVIFPGNTEPAFSNYRLWESFGFILAFTGSNLLCSIKIKLYILLGFVVVGMLGYLMIELKERRKKSNVSSSVVGPAFESNVIADSGKK